MMASLSMPTTIDLSRLSAPTAIEALDFETLYLAFKTRFLAYWSAQRAINPRLPVYDTQTLETEPAGIVGEAWSYLRLLDRQRVNDAIKALLAPLSKGADLDNLVADRNIERLVIIPATSTTPAVMESDEALLRRYLLSFDLPSAGSADRYLYEAWRAWPQNDDRTAGLWDARVNGFDVHGRRGDTDVVIIGPWGRLPTEPERVLVRNAVTATKVKPDAVSVAVLLATRRTYATSLVIEVPPGPDPDLVRQEAITRVRAAGNERMFIAGEVPAGLLAGAAYGPSIIKVRDLAPVLIEPDPYTVPVLTTVDIAVEVRT